MENEKPWEANVLMCANRLSRAIEERFNIEIQSATTLLPPPLEGQKLNVEAATEMIDLMVEYLFGTCVAIVSHYVSPGKEFEKAILDLVKEKFERIREMKTHGTFKPEIVT